MSGVEVPAFDLLDKQKEPYLGFGIPLPKSEERKEKLFASMDVAFQRLGEVFGFTSTHPDAVPEEIDKILREMLAEDWSPTDANANLFATDFGLVLTHALLERFGGKLIFRSDVELNHFSIWWEFEEKEAFPFHHVWKCLLNPDSNSLSTFFHGVGRVVGNERTRIR